MQSAPERLLNGKPGASGLSFGEGLLLHCSSLMG